MKKSFILASLVLFTATTASAMTPKEVYKKSSPGVVLILGSDGSSTGNGGTGSIISKDGHIITNAHVVISEATKAPYKTLYVFLKPDRIVGDNKVDLKNRYQLTCSDWSDKDNLDLALCKIVNPPANLTTINFTDPDDVEIGDSVVAVGHPEQGGLWTLTTGTISTVIANFNRIKGKDVFQTEASVNRGNSGGPLLDENGNMVGINTMIARKANDGLTITDINFSLKSSVAVNWLNSIGIKLAYATPAELQQQSTVSPAAEPVKTAPAVNRATVSDTMVASNSSAAPVTEVQGSKAEEIKVAANDKSAEIKVAEAPKAAEAPAKVAPAEAPKAAEAPAKVAPAEEPKAAEAPAKVAPAEEPKAAEAPAKVAPAEKPVIVITVDNPKEKAEVAKKMEAKPPVKETVAKEKVKGKKLDPKKAKPKIETEIRPFNMDSLRQSQIKEMENFMDEMRAKIHNRK